MFDVTEQMYSNGVSKYYIIISKSQIITAMYEEYKITLWAHD